MSNTVLEQDPTTPSQPSEETVWQRYSPHYEAPLSTLGSFALHALFIGLLLSLGFIASMFGLNPQKKAPPLEIAMIGGNGAAQGLPGAPGGPMGEKTPEQLKEDLKNPPKEKQPDPLVPREKLDASEIASLPQAIRDAPWAQEHIKRGNVNLDIFNKIGEPLFLSPEPPVENPGGQGMTQGTGQGGQAGQGGTGEKGSADLNRKRPDRQLRWKMQFSTQTDGHYIAQLNALGAILGIPKNPRGGDYWLVRDLSKRPAKLLNEDWTSLNRIQWTDGNPGSARAVAMTLGLPGVPTHFIAFMPAALEVKLVELEKKYRGLEEHQIFETEFEIIRVGGVYEPQVTRQVPK